MLVKFSLGKVFIYIFEQKIILPKYKIYIKV